MVQRLQQFEGTWDEITRHAAELQGKRLRVTVIENDGPPSSADRRLDSLRAWFDSHGPVTGTADDSRESIYEGRGE